MPKVVQRKPEIRIPTKATLNRYGLTVADWLEILRKQGYVCAICKKAPISGRWATDHEHVPNWKLLTAEQRRMYVRGVLCHLCNTRVIGRFLTLEKAVNAAAYFQQYHTRRPAEVHKPVKKRKVKRR